jgi:hypothetical protein
MLDGATRPASDSPARFATATVVSLAAVKLALHLFVLAVTPYGVHRDEFLYFSMGEHLRFWRMDFPPAIGLLTKFSILFFALGAFIAILITPVRRSLRTPWPWLAALAALALGSASIVGQLRLDFPVAGQMRELQGDQLAHVSFWSFLVAQPFMLGPFAFVVALLGAWALVAWKRLATFAVVGWTCIVTFLILLVLHGKAYYIGPIYPTLFAAGGVLLERMRPTRALHAGRRLLVGGIVATGLVFLPLGVPMLSPQQTAEWALRVGASRALRTNQGVVDRLPQDFADMIGWPEQASALARVLATLTPAERREAVIFANNYGEAGAAEFYRRRFGLPPVVSDAGSFWFFGPGERAGRVLVAIGEDSADVAQAYDDVRPVARILSPWSVEEERNVRIIIARQPKQTLQDLWPQLKDQ